MRYVTIPKPITPINPDTDALIEGVSVSFADYVRVLRKDPRFIQGVDMIEAYDATRALIKAEVGEAVPVQDATWDVLQAVAKRPTTLGPALIFAPDGATFTKAITDAPTSAPEVKPKERAS